jgi:Flp pilus assembly protein TadD
MALKLDPKSADAWHLLGAAAFKQDRLAEAEELIQRAIGRSRHNPYFSSTAWATCAGREESSMRRRTPIARPCGSTPGSMRRAAAWLFVCVSAAT